MEYDRQRIWISFVNGGLSKQTTVVVLLPVAIHVFLITYEMARQGGTGEPAARARDHFERAMALTDGQLAQPLVSLAEAVAVPAQNREEFESLLDD